MFPTFLAGQPSFTNVCFSKINIHEWVGGGGDGGGGLLLPEVFQTPFLCYIYTYWKSGLRWHLSVIQKWSLIHQIKARKSCLKPFLSLTFVGFCAVPVINVGQRLKVVAGAIKCSIWHNCRSNKILEILTLICTHLLLCFPCAENRKYLLSCNLETQYQQWEIILMNMAIRIFASILSSLALKKCFHLIPSSMFLNLEKWSEDQKTSEGDIPTTL